MRNSYPGICYFCGEYVQTGDGHFEKIRGVVPHRWRVIHTDCVMVQRQLKDCIKHMLLYRALMNWKLYFYYRNQARFLVKSLPKKDQSIRHWEQWNILCAAVDLRKGGLSWLSSFLSR